MKHRATVICIRDDKVLLVAKRRGRWALPGGSRKCGESLSAAAMRELQEETRLCALRIDYLFQFWGARTRHFIFVAHVAANEHPKPDNEIARCQWVRPQGVRRLPASISTKGIALYIACVPSLLGNTPLRSRNGETSAFHSPLEAHDVSHDADESIEQALGL
ncbi:NUDIX domain-containing protein [Paraburkholderia phymatum]|nr:NUDIX domain-containing protein [Paraburkholderia phymatum]